MSGKSISLRAHAKVNLSLYVTGRRDDGYHDIVSFMQGVSLYDEVTVALTDDGQVPETPAAGGFTYQSAPLRMGGYQVTLASDAEEMPYDMRNLALRGAAAVLGPAAEAAAGADGAGADLPQIRITVRKRLPVAAGIAGGSGNAAASMLAVDHLLGYPYSLRELMARGAGVGADVPFSLLMNAYYNREELADLPGIAEASPAAVMCGIGDVVEPAEPLEYEVLMMNPGTGISTALAYRAIDERPEPDRGPYDLFYNAFEEYTYRTDSEAWRLREAMEKHLHADHTLLSGSGPTTVAYYKCKTAALQDFETAQTAGWMDSNWKIWHAHSGGEEV